jgi:transcription elongation factor GreA
MHTTRMTGSMRWSLEARLRELEERLSVLERPREGDASLDVTALHLHLSRERDQIADALANATLIDDDPYDTEAIEIGDMVTVRAIEGGVEERYILVDQTVGSRTRPDWMSAISPLGAALLGRGKGDEVAVQTPGGIASYRILDFERYVDVEESKDPANRMVDHTSDARKTREFQPDTLPKDSWSVDELVQEMKIDGPAT